MAVVPPDAGRAIVTFGSTADMKHSIAALQAESSAAAGPGQTSQPHRTRQFVGVTGQGPGHPGQADSYIGGATWSPKSTDLLPTAFGPMSISPAVGVADIGMAGLGSFTAADLAAMWDEEDEEDPAVVAALLSQAAFSFQSDH
eukprot:gene11979-12122_t